MRSQGHPPPSSVGHQRREEVIVEAVIFVGLQGSGKSTFYRERFFYTHLRLNLDMLKTRHRERKFLNLCVETGLRFVVDNTNPSRTERAIYIQAAKAAGFRIVGYYFQSRVGDCQRRNLQRPPAQHVPLRGLLGAAGRMERPGWNEGFDELFYVRIDDSERFVVEEWRDEDR